MTKPTPSEARAALENPNHPHNYSCPFLKGTFELPVEPAPSFALFPYSCLRDTSVDILGLARLLYGVRRQSWSRGWSPFIKQKEEEKKKEEKQENQQEEEQQQTENKEKEPEKKEGEEKEQLKQILLPPTPTAETTRTYMASQLLVLANTGVYDKAVDDIAEVLAEGKAAVAHVGSSSFSLFSEATAVDPIAQIRCFIGFNLISLVNVDFETRKPKKLPEAQVEKLKSALESMKTSERVKSIGCTPLGRLPDTTTVLSGATSTGHEMFEHSVHIRSYNDFDFNSHVNQSKYLEMIVDAVTKMTATEELKLRQDRKEKKKKKKNKNSEAEKEQEGEEQEKEKGGGEEEGEEELYQSRYLNSTVRSIRIDYLNEVAEREAKVLVLLHSGHSVNKIGVQHIGEELLNKIKNEGEVQESTSGGGGGGGGQQQQQKEPGSPSLGKKFKLAANPTIAATFQRISYFTISQGEKICCRGFVVFDSTMPCPATGK